MEVQADDRREAPTAEDVIGVGGVGHAQAQRPDACRRARESCESKAKEWAAQLVRTLKQASSYS
jgi:hypothetical protein